MGAIMTVVMGFLGTFFSGFVGWLFTFFTHKVARAALVVSLAVSAVGAFYAVCSAALSGLSLAWPGVMWQGFAYMIFTDNLPACLTAYASVWAGLKVIQWARFTWENIT
ncbi:DUF5455 family protein [Silvimonas sp.]|uniref:DUF5455 family protein n=1 Tax=Silvimonas sp. TaxID=2650811 RepID=UPI00284D3A8B|nr:DUF5455 family protein [Silvimonas sp.]MDR3426913.1 DUF5455 family protein [Silvimonas sp.]